MSVTVAAAGVDTWSPSWYVGEDSPAARALDALATQRTARGNVLPEKIDGHRVGWFRSQRLVYAEGHPDRDGGLACAETLPPRLEALREAIADVGIPLPEGQTAALWRPHERRAGFAGIRRLDSTCDLQFESKADGLAFLAGCATVGMPRAKQAVWRCASTRALETVAFYGHAGGRMLARVYDKSVEAGIGPRGTVIRPEDQRRFTRDTRRDVDELTSKYVREKFHQRFVPLWQASKGVTVGGPGILAARLADLFEQDELSGAQMEDLAGYALLEASGFYRQSSRTRRRRRAQLRELGLVLSDGTLDPVEVDMAEVLEAALDAEAWEGW